MESPGELMSCPIGSDLYRFGFLSRKNYGSVLLLFSIGTGLSDEERVNFVQPKKIRYKKL